MKDSDYDKHLHIKTESRKLYDRSDLHYYPYEPTPYSALDELVRRFEVKDGDRIVDFGCGKGRILFYIHHFFKVQVAGVEKNERLYRNAEENLESYKKRHRVKEGDVRLYNCLAEDYPVNSNDNHFYFFNPFSIEIFRTIIWNILQSYEKAPRDIEVLLYYPSEAYIDFLENQTPFKLKKEIVLKGLYETDVQERFLIYRLEF
ncbi:class I SAM-dependent methyltransferase [Pullulanibacillus sp. KACC 23026]|uniref:SAM-dependent methyltransferase n=1 Tax=Pullulanibacillus sp. KACC 23026 TaxID=3028315 RepID=UPI0023AF9E3C|nr:methyltransferase domain-containing protein [Pullulanibacillus sp. KACC 23026]WEG10930.1 class I SAM-dependent methyltransferase [Pullulanibacillus sp. KACC 23026]